MPADLDEDVLFWPVSVAARKLHRAWPGSADPTWENPCEASMPLRALYSFTAPVIADT